MRMGTWNVCMFVSYEQLKKVWLQHNENQRSALPKAHVKMSIERSTFGANQDIKPLPAL